jgi:ribosomal protein S6--L-glutamate ligase
VTPSSLRIGLLSGRYTPADQSYWPLVARLLADWGATVDSIQVAERPIDVSDLRVEHDLYVLKDKGDLAMSIAASLHAAGAAILNPYPSSAMLRDKIVTSHVLQAAGVPTPQSFVASHVEQLRHAVERGPLVVKPYRGSRGAGVHVVRDAAELDRLPSLTEPVYAQRYHPPDGRDRKLYAIGDELYGVLRVWPPRTDQDKLGEPFTPSRELADIARRCGAAFGLDLFGVDVVESGGIPYVVDMSSMPGFKGVPDAVRRVADYIHAAATRASLGDPVWSGGPGVRSAPVANRVFASPNLSFVLNALSTPPATLDELDQICKLLEQMKEERRRGA